jgi:hypothetical protein
VSNGFFRKDEFRYDAERDAFGQVLSTRYESKLRELTKIDYSNRAACLSSRAAGLAVYPPCDAASHTSQAASSSSYPENRQGAWFRPALGDLRGRERTVAEFVLAGEFAEEQCVQCRI